MEKYLIENYKTKTKKELAKELGLTYNQVEHKLRSLGLSKFSNKKYTDEEIAFIQENYPTKGSKYCAEQLNRSVNAINKKIKKMGLEINWKYVYVNADGYCMNCEDRNHRYLVHRRVMEEYLGRPLRPDEIVHHKDGNKLNNDISNLEIINRADHARYHMKCR